jgi:hypothetical protein
VLSAFWAIFHAGNSHFRANRGGAARREQPGVRGVARGGARAQRSATACGRGLVSYMTLAPEKRAFLFFSGHCEANKCKLGTRGNGAAALAARSAALPAQKYILCVALPLR